MNIEMINNHNANRTDMDHITYGKPSSDISRMRTQEMGFSLDITGKVRENAAYGKEELKSAEEIAQMAGMTDVNVQRDYMAVMSNSMSDEDFAKLMEDGVNPTSIPVGETVTNLDRIKIKMAESGVTVAGYNDDLTEDDIRAVLGNSINAGKIIADTLTASDLPDTGDNISQIKETVMMAQNLGQLTDEAKAFMIREDMSPTVENLYMAEYSAAGGGALSYGVHFDGAATYAGGEYTQSSWEDLKEQAIEVIKEAGFEDTDTAIADAKWIAMHELPLTKDTITAYEEIKDLEVPAKPQDLIAAITVAVEEGKSAKSADITQTKSLYEKASEIVESFRDMEDPADLTRRRQLEEVRLVMTKEANLTLLRKGINIETEPLEQLVNELREAEREFYAPLLSDDKGANESGEIDTEDIDGKIDLYKQTVAVLHEIPAVPVRIIAEKASSDDFNLGGIARDGAAMSAVYRRAGESYEALMTAPRADMGDSIRKAFRNVDDILADLDMDVNEANRKAVRTLGYAGMMINRETVDDIRSATASVERVISLMTPAKTLSMIREGHNPLSENIYELEQSLSGETFEESGEKYSRFLLRLARSGDITEDEKQTFIGMYRLFNTIEKQDGKVIGNVLSSGRELTLENMLEASRSNRRTGGEYVIDDDFGFLEELTQKGETITAQLGRTFTQLIDPKIDKEYVEEKQKEVRQAGRMNREATDILAAVSEPVTVENILAASAMTGGMGKGYKKLFSGGNDFRDDDTGRDRDSFSEEDAASVADSLSDRESIAESYERFLDKAQRLARDNAMAADSYEDVKAYSMIYKQVGFAASLAGSENYEIPVKLSDGWTSVHLTIVHNENEAGKVRISFESEDYGRVEATFGLKASGVDGFVVSDSRAGVDNLKQIDDKIREGFRQDNMETANLSYVFSNNTGNDGYLSDPGNEQVTDSRLYRIAKAFIGAIQ